MIRWVFLSVMMLMAATLVCLGWWLLEQDQLLAEQRLTEQRENAAELTVAALDNRLLSIEQDLTVGKHVPAKGAIFVEFEQSAIRIWPEHGLPFYPQVTETPEAPPELFESAEELEFRRRENTAALAALRPLATSSDLKVRAAALVRIARIHLNAGRSLKRRRRRTRA